MQIIENTDNKKMTNVSITDAIFMLAKAWEK